MPEVVGDPGAVVDIKTSRDPANSCGAGDNPVGETYPHPHPIGIRSAVDRQSVRIRSAVGRHSIGIRSALQDRHRNGPPVLASRRTFAAVDAADWVMIQLASR